MVMSVVTAWILMIFGYWFLYKENSPEMAMFLFSFSFFIFFVKLIKSIEFVKKD
jgi:hypothetical protein